MDSTTRRIGIALSIGFILCGGCGGGSGGGGAGPTTHAVRGTLTPAVAGTRVTLGGAASASTTTDGTGAFQFLDLADGRYTVTPSAEGVLFQPQRRTADVAGADVALGAFAGTALRTYDALSSEASPSGQRWENGQRRIFLDQGAAVLTSRVADPLPDTNYAEVLSLRPDAVAGRVLSVQAKVSLDQSSVAGGTAARAFVDLMFQPLANRVAGPNNLIGAVFLRAGLLDQASGLTAVRQAFACTNPTCTTASAVGAPVAGATWTGAGEPIARLTPYTLSVSLDPATSEVTYRLSGGAYTTARTARVDLAAVAAELAADRFFKVRLGALVRSGVGAGAGAGSVEGRFDDVVVGTDGSASAFTDGFDTGTTLDPSRWTPAEEGVTVLGPTPPVAPFPEFHLRLVQADRPGVTALNLVPTAAPTALHARAKVTAWSLTGTGQVGARLATALYNDGSPGKGPAPDVPGASSQVGDVVAQLSMSATDVSWAVIRCKVAVCTGAQSAAGDLDFLQPRTSLGTVALGELHALRISWDAAGHTVSFQLDDLPPVSFDPVAAGAPVAGAPGRPFWQLGVHAGAAAQGVDFTTGSLASVAGVFQDVRVLP